MNITITKTTSPKPKPADESKLGFAKTFSDHMFLMDYEEGKGWFNARIEPYHKLEIDPASPVLHYAQEIFEGSKAYRTKSGDIQLFRVRDNARRLNRSAERMCMPEIDVEDNVKAISALVDLERDWVPKSPGTTMYLRPTMIADGAALGVQAASKYIYYVICAPSGAYFNKPVKIHIEDEYVRAVRGGTGYAKTGGNYAASLKASTEAEKRGYDQVLWLDALERKYVEEVGGMNIMFVINGAVCTAPIGGSILEGITRMSLLQLAQDLGLKVEERRITVDELISAGKSGELTEAFGVGTAAVVSPVCQMAYKGQTIDLKIDTIGPIAKQLYDTLVGIQYGDIEDKYGWITKV